MANTARVLPGRDAVRVIRTATSNCSATLLRGLSEDGRAFAAPIMQAEFIGVLSSTNNCVGIAAASCSSGPIKVSAHATGGIRDPRRDCPAVSCRSDSPMRRSLPKPLAVQPSRIGISSVTIVEPAMASARWSAACEPTGSRRVLQCADGHRTRQNIEQPVGD